MIIIVIKFGQVLIKDSVGASDKGLKEFIRFHKISKLIENMMAKRGSERKSEGRRPLSQSNSVETQRKLS
jgi:hypothetical protein